MFIELINDLTAVIKKSPGGLAVMGLTALLVAGFGGLISYQQASKAQMQDVREMSTELAVRIQQLETRLSAVETRLATLREVEGERSRRLEALENNLLVQIGLLKELIQEDGP